MKKKILSGFIAFLLVVVGISSTSFDDVITISAEQVTGSYSLDGYLGDKDGYQELVVGDIVNSWADLTSNDGKEMNYGEQWEFVEDQELDEANITYLYYSNYDNVKDAQQDRVDFKGRIPNDAFGKYVYKIVSVRALPNKEIYTKHIRSTYTIGAWTENGESKYTVTLNSDGKTVTVFSIWGTGTSSSIQNSVKIDGKTYKVIRLGQVCLENKSLKKIIIPSGITEIGENAFKGGNKLKTIVINGNLKSVEKNAFAEINPKAVFNIKGSKKNYNKMVKLIKKSGVPKTVKFKNVK